MSPDLQFPTDLVTFTGEILDEKHFLHKIARVLFKTLSNIYEGVDYYD